MLQDILQQVRRHYLRLHPYHLLETVKPAGFGL
jgi:hypothetical protein